jgi:hypothetical protein
VIAVAVLAMAGITYAPIVQLPNQDRFWACGSASRPSEGRRSASSP